MQRILIVLVVGLLAVGCGKSFTEEDVVGTYEIKAEGNPMKLVLHENWTMELHISDVKVEDAKWKMVGKEIHKRTPGKVSIFKIESNGDLTVIARIRNGKREDAPKEEQATFKKIK